MDLELLKKLHIGVVVRCLQGNHKPHLKEFTQVGGARRTVIACLHLLTPSLWRCTTPCWRSHRVRIGLTQVISKSSEALRVFEQCVNKHKQKRVVHITEVVFGSVLVRELPGDGCSARSLDEGR